jgi:glutamate racemase
MQKAPIGIFDSGYGGLTVMKEIVNRLPQYDYLYLGDNARAPYGTRSFESIYQYTLECVKHLFDAGCPLIILACNTASARALRTIQQKDLAGTTPTGRVLGIIRPTAEIIGEYTQTRHIGIVGTSGTVKSESYVIEINKIYPDIQVYQEACPMWVPLVENDEYNNAGSAYFVKKHLDKLFSRSPQIDTILLGCTHYPLLMNTIKSFVPEHVNVLSQGKIVADSLADYLQRHPEIESRCSKNSTLEFTTTDSTELFDTHGSTFFGQQVASKHVTL